MFNIKMFTICKNISYIPNYTSKLTLVDINEDLDLRFLKKLEILKIVDFTGKELLLPNNLQYLHLMNSTIAILPKLKLYKAQIESCPNLNFIEVDVKKLKIINCPIQKIYGSVKKLDLADFRELPSFPPIKNLCLMDCDITDLNLPDIKELKIRSCDKINYGKILKFKERRPCTRVFIN